MVAGGEKLGLKQGQFYDWSTSGEPMSNLLHTFLHVLDVPVERFSDSTGLMKDLLI